LGKQFIINPTKFDTEAEANVLEPAHTIKKPEIFDTLCLACHAVAGKGGAIGPALDGTSKTRDPKWLREWLTDPQKIKPGTTMPKLPMSDNDLNALVEYLSVL
jgi:nitric oxide reductase subunit C